MVIRKKYDNMSKTREEIQREVEEMEKKRDKFVSEKSRFEEEKGRGSAKVQQLEDGLQGIKLQLEGAEVERKVMLGMADRLKSDKIVYDLRKYKLEKELAYIQKQKQIILKENAGRMEEGDRTKRIHQKLLEHL
jgi:predicted nuclease with TOPRIM domain